LGAVRKFVLDTNLYVKAFRSDQGARELEQYYRDFTPQTYLSSIVVHELLVGATSERKVREIRKNLLGPLIRAGRVITPSHSSWEQAGTAIAEMARSERRELRGIPKSLVHDFLLAASCREGGVTLVTENGADFELVRRYVRHEHVPPWPDRSQEGRD
jgi:predicted nucleic acid-binding protein